MIKLTSKFLHLTQIIHSITKVTHHIIGISHVQVTGFEPAAFATQTRHSDQTELHLVTSATDFNRPITTMADQLLQRIVTHYFLSAISLWPTRWTSIYFLGRFRGAGFLCVSQTVIFLPSNLILCFPSPPQTPK